MAGNAQCFWVFFKWEQIKQKFQWTSITAYSYCCFPSVFSFFLSANGIFLKLEYFNIFFVKQSSSDRSGSHFRLRKQTAAVGSYGFAFRITHGSFPLWQFVQVFQSPVYTLSSFHDVEEVVKICPFFGGSLCNRARDSSGPLGCRC